MQLAEHTIDLVKLALEYITLTIFFVFVLKAMGLRNSYANSLNLQYDLQVKTQQRLEFEKYVTGLDQNELSECLTADMVLEAIRKYSDGQICIYVDEMKDGSELYVDSLNAAALSDRLTVSALIANLDMVSGRYHPYLVYDNQDMRGPDYTNTGIEIKGIAFLKYR